MCSMALSVSYYSTSDCICNVVGFQWRNECSWLAMEDLLPLNSMLCMSRFLGSVIYPPPFRPLSCFSILCLCARHRFFPRPISSTDCKCRKKTRANIVIWIVFECEIPRVLFDYFQSHRVLCITQAFSTHLTTIWYKDDVDRFATYVRNLQS